MSFVEVLDPQGILEIVFSRPPVNAFQIDDLRRLATRLDAIADEPAVRVVVLRSEGRGFCAGGDLGEMERLAGFSGIVGQADGSYRASLAIAECAVPVVAAVHNYCIGVGVLLVGAADMVVAERSARFVLAEIDYGATAGAIQAAGLMPEKRLRSAMFTSEPVQASELMAYGSIHRLVDTGETAEAAMQAARDVASKSPAAIRAMKASINGSLPSRIRECYRREISYTYELNMLGEASRARRAFLEASSGSSPS